MTRVAVLVDGETLPAYAANAVERMVDETDATVPLVVRNETTGDGPLDLLRKGLEKPHWLRIRGGQMLVHSAFGTPAYKRSVSIDDVAPLADADRIGCTPRPAEGLGQRLPEEVVETVTKRSDVVFRQGFGIVTGEILTAPTHGVLSYHHGDPREYRGGPPGFWEFLHGRERGGMMLQRLREELDGGGVVVYDEVDISDASTWREVQRRQYRASEDFLARAVEKLDDPDFEPREMELGPVRTAPRLPAYLKYVGKNTLGRLGSRRL